MNDTNQFKVEKDSSLLFNAKSVACTNNYFRREIWTGDYAQITVMSIPAGGEVGLEIHENLDQIFLVEYGIASVYAGKSKSSVVYKGCAKNDCMVVIPAGTFHNLLNEQSFPLKLVSVYAPPQHPVGTAHKTKFESDLQE